MKLNVTKGSQKLTFDCSEPFEQFVANGKKRWVLAFCIKNSMTSEEVEAVFCHENMESLTFETDDGSTAWIMNGYTHLSSAVIRRSADGGTSVEIQAIKYITETEAIGDGEV